MRILTLASIVSNAGENTISPQSADIFGIVGILVTLLVGVLTAFVTWKATLRTIKQNRLSYSLQVFPILSNSLANKKSIHLEEFQIKYRDKQLQNPCLLTLDIQNTGNYSIKNPKIRIHSHENIGIFPAYLEEVPDGYEELWGFDNESNGALLLDHINPKQIVKARFYLDDIPKDRIIFECPMPDLKVDEIRYDVSSKVAHFSTINSPRFWQTYQGANILLMAFTALILFATPYIESTIDTIAWYMNIYLPDREIISFISATLLLAVIFNLIGLNRIDNYIKANSSHVFYISIGVLVVVSILLTCVITNFLITSNTAQIIVAIICSVLLAVLVHFLIISNTKQ